MRRPRGPGGRFLTAEEIAAQKAAATEAAAARDDDDERDDGEDSPRDMAIDSEPSPVSPNPPRPAASQPPAQSHPPAPVPVLAPAPPPQQQQPPVSQFQAGHRNNHVNLVNIPYHQIQPQQPQSTTSPTLYQDMRVPSHSQAQSSASAQATHSHAGLRGFHAPPQPPPTAPPPTTPSATPLPSQIAAVHTTASPAPGVLRSPFNVMQMHHIPHPHAHARHHHTRLNIAQGLYGPDGGAQSGRT
jgi:nuclear transcription factor Y, alpha